MPEPENDALPQDDLEETDPRLAGFRAHVERRLKEFDRAPGGKEIRSSGKLSEEFASTWVRGELERWGWPEEEGDRLVWTLVAQGVRQMFAHYGVERGGPSQERDAFGRRRDATEARRPAAAPRLPVPEHCIRCGRAYDPAEEMSWMSEYHAGVYKGAVCEGCTTDEENVASQLGPLDEPGAELVAWEDTTAEEKWELMDQSLHIHTMSVVRRHIDIAKAEGSVTIALDFEAWGREAVDTWPVLKQPAPQEVRDKWLPMAVRHALLFLKQDVPQDLLDRIDEIWFSDDVD